MVDQVWDTERTRLSANSQILISSLDHLRMRDRRHIHCMCLLSLILRWYRDREKTDPLFWLHFICYHIIKLTKNYNEVKYWGWGGGVGGWVVTQSCATEEKKKKRGKIKYTTVSSEQWKYFPFCILTSWGLNSKQLYYSPIKLSKVSSNEK